MYADYLFYTTTFGGTLLSSEQFLAWLQKASVRLLADTNGKAPSQTLTSVEVQLAVKLCLCAMAEALYEENLVKTQGGAIVSEQIGGWSRKYQTQKASASTITKVQNLYLAHTGLLYRGRGCA